MSLSKEEINWIRWKHGTYGMLAEFRCPRELVEGLKTTLAAGYTRLDTFSPFGVEEVTKLLELREPGWIAGLSLGYGLLGAVMAFAWQAYDNGRFYPMNVGGRSFFAWPAYVVPTLDVGIFSAVAAMFIGILWMGRLPRYHHPVFNVRDFSRASIDRFFLLIIADDPRFHAKETMEFLMTLEPYGVHTVPNVRLTPQGKTP